MNKLLHVVLAVLLWGALAARAFLPPTDHNGPLTVTIADPGEVQALEKSIAVPVTLSNSSAQPLPGKLRIAVTDAWRIEGQASRAFVVPANGQLVLPVSVIAGRGTYAALYPVHAYAEFEGPGGKPATAHAILIASVAHAAVSVQQLPALREQLEAPARGLVN